MEKWTHYYHRVLELSSAHFSGYIIFIFTCRSNPPFMCTYCVCKASYTRASSRMHAGLHAISERARNLVRERYIVHRHKTSHRERAVERRVEQKENKRRDSHSLSLLLSLTHSLTLETPHSRGLFCRVIVF